MAYIVDNAIAVRVIYLLVTPFTEWDAYKQGIIDENGKILKKDPKPNDDWTMLHRLVCRLKYMLGKVPGGDTKLASWAAAYLLVRECLEKNQEPDNLEEVMSTLLREDVEIDVKVLQECSDILNEDAPVNVAGNVPTIDKPLGVKRRVKRRAISKNVETVVAPDHNS